MPTTTMNISEMKQDLGDGLILRHATRRDTAGLIALHDHAFANPDTGALDEQLDGWTRDLMRTGTKKHPAHPTFRPKDFLLVEDTKTGAVVSCLCLISQTWTYAGIPFGVGRVELVATHENYRRRGLVRAQFRLLHEISAQRGETVQAITGIPYYYRQYGYEYALTLSGVRYSQVPQQVQPKLGAVRLRPATTADFPFVAELIERGAARSLVNCRIDEAMLAYQQYGEKDPQNGFAGTWNVIETRKGERLGILKHRAFVLGGRVNTHMYELLPGVSWLETTPAVMSAFAAGAVKLPARDGKPLTGLNWYLAANHPLFDLFPDRMTPTSDPYEWYLRVADVPAFLRSLAPVLEKRLAASLLADYSGTLHLNFFKSGVALTFAKGKLTGSEPWQSTATDFGFSGFGDATFPDYTFLKLLFGYRSYNEVHNMAPDCTVANDQIQALLDILFPKQVSHVVPVH